MAEPVSPRQRLLCFADDWGRHPSSAQHLVRHLLPRWDVTWFNTIGTRRPTLTAADLRRALQRLRVGARAAKPGAASCAPHIVAPFMYPGFRTRWQRALNAAVLQRAVARAVGRPSPQPSPKGRGSEATVAVTTLPITADVVGRVAGVTRWVYYCVDDFSVWPGLDGGVMDAMERRLVQRVDALVCVSETLRERMKQLGRDDAALLTHGVDLEQWDASLQASDDDAPEAPHVHAGLRPSAPPRALFWGLIDERLDHDFVRHLARAGVAVTLLGPGADVSITGVAREPAVPHADLPARAAAADVLVMPYVDAPVTRAMQPLKLLEYLATMRPVVVRDLPATGPWADCCDVAATAEEFARTCVARAAAGTPPEQLAARRRRLPAEAWSEKARCFERILRGQPISTA